LKWIINASWYVFVCAVHPPYQLASSLPHQLTSYLVNIIGVVTATIARCRHNLHKLGNVKCETITNMENKKGVRGGGLQER
jgi:hypothetical protein